MFVLSCKQTASRTLAKLAFNMYGVSKPQVFQTRPCCLQGDHLLSSPHLLD